MTFSDQMLAQRLGFFGLVPFILLAAGPWVFYEHTALLLQGFQIYSATILAFMAGTLWGVCLGRQEADPGSLLVAAGIALAAMISFVLPGRTTLALLAAGFLLLLQWERRNIFPAVTDDWYPMLRQRLTWTALACHVVAFWNLWLPPAQG